MRRKAYRYVTEDVREAYTVVLSELIQIVVPFTSTIAFRTFVSTVENVAYTPTKHEVYYVSTYEYIAPPATFLSLCAEWVVTQEQAISVHFTPVSERSFTSITELYKATVHTYEHIINTIGTYDGFEVYTAVWEQCEPSGVVELHVWYTPIREQGISGSQQAHVVYAPCVIEAYVHANRALNSFLACTIETIYSRIGTSGNWLVNAYERIVSNLVDMLKYVCVSPIAVDVQAPHGYSFVALAQSEEQNKVWFTAQLAIYVYANIKEEITKTIQGTPSNYYAATFERLLAPVNSFNIYMTSTVEQVSNLKAARSLHRYYTSSIEKVGGV